MGGKVKGLDVVRSTLKRLRDVASVKGLVAKVPDAAEHVIDMLARGGRDLTVTTQTLVNEVDAAIEKGTKMVAAGAPSGTPWKLAGEAILRRLRLRVGLGGADVSYDPRKDGGRLFYRSGQLLRDLSESKTTTRK